jgi:hypothetical protein
MTPTMGSKSQSIQGFTQVHCLVFCAQVRGIGMWISTDEIILSSTQVLTSKMWVLQVKCYIPACPQVLAIDMWILQVINYIVLPAQLVATVAL